MEESPRRATVFAEPTSGFLRRRLANSHPFGRCLSRTSSHLDRWTLPTHMLRSRCFSEIKSRRQPAAVAAVTNHLPCLPRIWRGTADTRHDEVAGRCRRHRHTGKQADLLVQYEQHLRADNLVSHVVSPMSTKFHGRSRLEQRESLRCPLQLRFFRPRCVL